MEMEQSLEILEEIDRWTEGKVLEPVGAGALHAGCAGADGLIVVLQHVEFALFQIRIISADLPGLGECGYHDGLTAKSDAVCSPAMLGFCCFLNFGDVLYT